MGGTGLVRVADILPGTSARGIRKGGVGKSGSIPALGAAVLPRGKADDGRGWPWGGREESRPLRGAGRDCLKRGERSPATCGRPKNARIVLDKQPKGGLIGASLPISGFWGGPGLAVMLSYGPSAGHGRVLQGAVSPQ